MRYLESQLTLILSFLLNLLPLEVSFWLASRLGDCLYYLLSKRRGIALSNIESVFGDSLSQAQKKRMARRSFQNLSLSITELFLVEKIKKRAAEHLHLVGREHLERAHKRGKGIVLVISHLGSWEFLSFLPFLTGQKWSVVVKELRNPRLNQIIHELRRKMHIQPIPKINSIKSVLKELRHNHGVAILIDQWAGDEGMWLKFFHRETSTTSIPSRLAKQTGCALVPAFCLRDRPGRYTLLIDPEAPFEETDPDWEVKTTENLNRLLEKKILQYPDQWNWVHRRWKKRPDSTRNR